MPKNTEKIKANKVREDMARKYAGKLKAKDQAIRVLQADLENKNRQIGSLNQENLKLLAEIAEKDALIQELQGMSGMTPEDLARLRKDMASRKKIRDTVLPLLGRTGPIYGNF